MSLLQGYEREVEGRRLEARPRRENVLKGMAESHGV